MGCFPFTLRARERHHQALRRGIPRSIQRPLKPHPILQRAPEDARLHLHPGDATFLIALPRLARTAGEKERRDDSEDEQCGTHGWILIASHLASSPNTHPAPLFQRLRRITRLKGVWRTLHIRRFISPFVSAIAGQGRGSPPPKRKRSQDYSTPTPTHRPPPAIRRTAKTQAPTKNKRFQLNSPNFHLDPLHRG